MLSSGGGGGCRGSVLAGGRSGRRWSSFGGRGRLEGWGWRGGGSSGRRRRKAQRAPQPGGMAALHGDVSNELRKVLLADLEQRGQRVPAFVFEGRLVLGKLLRGEEGADGLRHRWVEVDEDEL